MKIIRAEHLGMCFGVRDAIALAVRVHCPIYVEEDVIKRAGVALDGETDAEGITPIDGEEAAEGEQVDESSLSVFRDFINSLDIDDLGRGGDSPGK